MHKLKSVDTGLLILRIGMGLAMAYHGYQKIFQGVMPMMIDGVGKMGFPAPTLFAWLAALSEFVGGLCIAIGFGTRIAAFFVLIVMCVAFFVAHAKDPFQAKELAFLFGINAIALIFAGAGRFSVDAHCCKSKQ